MNSDAAFFRRRGKKTLMMMSDTSGNPAAAAERESKRLVRTKKRSAGSGKARDRLDAYTFGPTKPKVKKEKKKRRAPPLQDDVLGLRIADNTVPAVPKKFSQRYDASTRRSSDRSSSARRSPTTVKKKKKKEEAGAGRLTRTKKAASKKSGPADEAKASRKRALKAMFSIQEGDPVAKRTAGLEGILSPSERDAMLDMDDLNTIATAKAQARAQAQKEKEKEKQEPPLRGVPGKGLEPTPVQAPVQAPVQVPVARKLSKADLVEDQLKVYDAMLAGKNVLMLGEGGTGKTELIKYFKRLFKARRKAIRLTASTGKAALLIGGKTLHSFAGIGLGKGTANDLIVKVKGNRWAAKGWKAAKILVIDEISMISAELLYKLDRVAKAVRNSSEPFGGLQLLGSGDFLQLPPVKADFCFKHKVFYEIFKPENCFVLRHNFRQKKDPLFRKVLCGIRWGNVTPEIDALMKARVGVQPPEHVHATVIYPLRKQVDALNREKMDELPGETRSFKHAFHSLPSVGGAQAQFLHKMLLSSAPCSDVLELKVGAMVMHTWNNKDTGKVNGSMGKVVSFDPMTGHPIVEFNDGSTHPVEPNAWTSPDKKASVVQYPLYVAWAITVHKAQGATMDATIMDLGDRVFEYNQASTAAGRVRSLKDLYLIAWDKRVARPHPEAIAFYRERGVPEAIAAQLPGSAFGTKASISSFGKQGMKQTGGGGGGKSGGGGGKGESGSVSGPMSMPRSVSICESYLVFTEQNGWEGESWHRYFPCESADSAPISMSALQERLDKLNLWTAVRFKGKRNADTRFTVREAVVGETDQLQWKFEEGGSCKVHETMDKPLDMKLLVEQEDDMELFQMLYKCGVEACTA